jgi:hypothetical protein
MLTSIPASCVGCGAILFIFTSRRGDSITACYQEGFIRTPCVLHLAAVVGRYIILLHGLSPLRHSFEFHYPSGGPAGISPAKTPVVVGAPQALAMPSAWRYMLEGRHHEDYLSDASCTNGPAWRAEWLGVCTARMSLRWWPTKQPSRQNTL